MSKRSSFARRAMDEYLTTDRRAVARLAPHLKGVRSFAEPCAGSLDLVIQLTEAGLVCAHWSDLRGAVDALSMKSFGDADAIITNPPWTRSVLHRMILHFQHVAPTWLLFDSDWAYTQQAAPFLPSCSDIVAVGRLIWIPGSSMTGKDNCSWYRFDAAHSSGPRFHGLPVKPAGAFA